MDEALEEILEIIFDQAKIWKHSQLPFQCNIKAYIRSKMAAMPKPPPPQIHSNP